MGEPITDIEAAEAALKRLVAWDHEPRLTDGEGGELRGFLEDNVVCEVWEAGAARVLGDVVIPTADKRNGLAMRCVRPGVCGDDEPDWSVFSASALFVREEGSPRRGTLADGDAAWVAHGPEQDLWSVEDAASDAWRAKAGKCTDLVTTNRAGNQYNWSDIYTRCMEQANSHGGAFIV